MTSKPNNISPRLTRERVIVEGPFHMFCWLTLAKCIWKGGIMQQSISHIIVFALSSIVIPLNIGSENCKLLYPIVKIVQIILVFFIDFYYFLIHINIISHMQIVFISMPFHKRLYNNMIKVHILWD